MRGLETTITPLGYIVFLMGIVALLDYLLRGIAPSLEGVAFQVHWSTVLGAALVLALYFGVCRYALYRMTA